MQPLEMDCLAAVIHAMFCPLGALSSWHRGCTGNAHAFVPWEKESCWFLPEPGLKEKKKENRKKEKRKEKDTYRSNPSIQKWVTLPTIFCLVYFRCKI